MINSWHKPRGILALALVVGLSPLAWGASQTTYKWLDEGGNVTYGDHPPMGVEAQEIRISTGTSSNNDDNAAESPAADSKSGNATIAAANSGVSPEKAKELCEQAKNNLEVLENSALIRQTDENGEVRILGDEEKKEQIDTAKTIKQQYCK